MKSEGAIRQKLKQVRFRHAKWALTTDLERTSASCVHNTTLEVPQIGTVRLCGLSDTPLLCDAVRGADLAPSCENYLCRTTREGVKQDFDALFSGSIPEIAAKYPDAAALLWVLTDDPPNPDASLLDPFTEHHLAGTYFDIPVWTASEKDSSRLDAGIETLLNDLDDKTEALTKAQEELSALLSEVQELRVKSSQNEAALLVVESEVTDRIAPLEKSLREIEAERDRLRSQLDLPWWNPRRWFR